jgi:transcriptional regulator with XRE-family HTH domain
MPSDNLLAILCTPGYTCGRITTMDDIPIGALIKASRRHRGLSVAAVAEGAGISTRYLEMIEAGARVPSIEVLGRIADTLDIPTQTLVTPPHASEDYAALETALFGPQCADGPDSETTRERLQQAAAHWTASVEHYRAAITLLPDLIRAATSSPLATEIYRLTEEVTRQARPDLAAAAQRARQAQTPATPHAETPPRL